MSIVWFFVWLSWFYLKLKNILLNFIQDFSCMVFAAEAKSNASGNGQHGYNCTEKVLQEIRRDSELRKRGNNGKD